LTALVITSPEPEDTTLDDSNTDYDEGQNKCAGAAQTKFLGRSERSEIEIDQWRPGVACTVKQIIEFIERLERGDEIEG
jgi:hypothetical protein